MGALRTRNGKLLIVDGKLAIANDCCCNLDCAFGEPNVGSIRLTGWNAIAPCTVPYGIGSSCSGDPEFYYEFFYENLNDTFDAFGDEIVRVVDGNQLQYMCVDAHLVDEGASWPNLGVLVERLTTYTCENGPNSVEQYKYETYAQRITSCLACCPFNDAPGNVVCTNLCAADAGGSYNITYTIYRAAPPYTTWTAITTFITHYLISNAVDWSHCVPHNGIFTDVCASVEQDGVLYSIAHCDDTVPLLEDASLEVCIFGGDLPP